MPQYVAFLRGINSGRNPTVKMEVLRKIFEDLGLKNVRTFLASGNVLFEADSTDGTTLEQQIEHVLPATIGFQSSVIIRTTDEIRHLVVLHPFAHIPLNPARKTYVTLVQGRPETSLVFPVEGKGYTILGIVDGVICSVVDLTEAKTPDLMKVLDKEFGKGNTTRSWNTIERIVNVSPVINYIHE
jgi:uncharacterized protein (DUF1697 family)